MRNIYLAQVNYQYGNNTFLPYSVGRLWAHAKQSSDIAANYRVAEFLFLRENPIKLVNRIIAPDVVGISCYIWNWEWCMRFAQMVRFRFPDCLIVIGGPQVLNNAETFMHNQKPLVTDICVHGEGETAFAEILKARLQNNGYEHIPGLTLRSGRTGANLRNEKPDALASPYLTGVFDKLMALPYDWHALQETNRGCPYACLAGNTIVNTVQGDLPIKEIAERFKTIGVYTYDRTEKKAKISTAKNIGVTGRNRELIRVLFDDGTHIDCTPDHIFLVFKWGNQFADEKEWMIEAKDLQTGMRTRAVRFELNEHSNRMCVTWSRRGRMYRYKMIMEWLAGRGIERTEHIHHIDGNSLNDDPSNLELFSSAKDHFDRHPEISERMKKNNPAKHMTPEWRLKIGQSNTGKKRSQQARERYRQAAIKREGELTADMKSARSLKSANTKRAKGISQGNSEKDSVTGRFVGNHKVISVTSLPGLHDVYCMEVPETGWFYANNVLVKNCSFCDWGSATFSKVIEMGLDDVRREIDWFSKNRIDLLYNCDSNYGMLKQDEAITDMLVEAKKNTGYPNKFRAAYAKKTTDRVYSIAKKLNDAGMSKGVTLSFQSLNKETLDMVKRRNITNEVFGGLMEQYAKDGIPTYSEIILGLPGETLETFKEGLCSLLELGQHDGINVYPCIMLPNSEMADPLYRRLHKLKTVRTPIMLLHGTPARNDIVEYYDLIIETSTMPHKDWCEAFAFAWMIQAFHCMGLTQHIAREVRKLDISYRVFYDGLMDFAQHCNLTVIGREFRLFRQRLLNALQGKGWDIVIKDCGDITWPPEEATFLSIVNNLDRFYHEIKSFADKDERVIEQQKEMIYSPKEFDGTMEDYAREIVWYGRKGGKKLKQAAAQ